MKKMRRIFYFVLSLLFVLAVFSFGVYACSPEQVIMRISSSTNAHGEVWNGTGNYTVEICYNEVFGFDYTGVDPHPSTCINPVLWLSSETNAHAELPVLVPAINNYDVPVCYGNLVCMVKNNKSECDDFGGKIIVSLSALTNAHLSSGDNVGYPKKICCKSGVEVTGAFWADMNEQPIIGTGADIKDRVKLMVAGGGMENKEINYTIYKNVPFWFDTEISQTSSLGFITWRAGKKDDGTFEEGTFYFTAEVGGENFESGNLVVSAPEDNSKPVGVILTPEVGEIYLVNQNVSFSEDSYDVDDEIVSKNWSENGVEISTEDSFIHQFTSTGQKNILLEAKDERGAIGTDRTSILVLNLSQNGKQVFAHISEPEWGDVKGKEVDFDASTSYAVEVNSGVINCTAGPCPTQTHDGTPIVGGTQDLDDLYFNWSFSDESEREGFGESGAVFSKTFTRPSTPEEPHWARLTVSINPSSSTSTEFNVYFAKAFCVYDDYGDSFWIESDGMENSFNNCRKSEDEVDEDSSTECCPSWASVCGEDGVCREGALECEDYETEEECEDYSASVPEAQLNPILEEDGYECGMSDNYGNKCDEKINCECTWDEDAGECYADSEHKICKNSTCYDFDNLPPTIDKICTSSYSAPAGKCIFTFSNVDDCENSGFRYRAWTVTWTGLSGTKPLYCKSGKDEISCISGALLGFFDTINLIIAIIIIVAFYLIVIRKRKKYRKGEKYGKRVKRKK